MKSGEWQYTVSTPALHHQIIAIHKSTSWFQLQLQSLIAIQEFSDKNLKQDMSTFIQINFHLLEGLLLQEYWITSQAYT